jgi:hypothetical protein
VPIVPLPIFEQDADPARRGGALTDEQAYERLKPPTTIKALQIEAISLGAPLSYVSAVAATSLSLSLHCRCGQIKR